MKIAIVMGGKSSEHSVSVVTGIQAYEAICDKHDILPIFIDKLGVWRVGNWNHKPTLKSLKKGKALSINIEKSCFCTKFKQYHVDCALLCLHGMNGEDGSVQGLLQLANIPYTCSGISASAIGLDKALFKAIMQSYSMPVVNSITVTKHSFRNNFDEVCASVSAIGFPVIIKPCRLGSSIGISVATNVDELFYSLKTALSYDDKAIVEEKLTDFTEVNCAVLSTPNGIVVSDVEQPVRSGEILDYNDKYAFDTRLSIHKIPAPIGKRKTEKVRLLSEQVYSILECKGVARIDFLLTKNDIFINEINTTPGALASYLFVSEKLSFADICQSLIDGAIKAHNERNSLVFSYENELFSSK